MIGGLARPASRLAAFAVLAALGIGMVFGTTLAVATLAIALLLPLATHFRDLARLVRWLHQPLDTPLPEGRGIWDFIFSALERRVRQRQAFQEAQAAALQSFRALAEALPDGVVQCDREFRVQWVNPMAAAHLMLDPDRDPGHSLLNIVREPSFVAYIHAREFDEPCVHRCQRGGATLTVQVVPLSGDGYLLVTRDVSHQDRVERMRRDFVANVSHELKTPLTIISGFSETLIDGRSGDCRCDTLRYVDMIHQQAARMGSIIRDLLTLAALEQSESAGKDLMIDMQSLIRSVVRDAENLSAGQHRIEASIAPEVPDLLGAPTEILAALANLVNNAVRYTPAGGRIVVSWGRRGRGAEFSVLDSGIGIAAEHIPRLTERFYRVRQAGKQQPGGSGLGLAITKHVLARHEAELCIHSEIGVGSCFRVSFPEARLSAGDAPLEDPEAWTVKLLRPGKGPEEPSHCAGPAGALTQ